MKRDRDYTVEEKAHQVIITEEGAAEAAARGDDDDDDNDDTTTMTTTSTTTTTSTSTSTTTSMRCSRRLDEVICAICSCSVLVSGTNHDASEVMSTLLAVS